MRKSLISTLALAAVLAIATPVAAQDQQNWTPADENRSVIMRFLEREEVGGVADDMGYDVQDMGRGVLQLNDAEASRVADQVRSAEQAMATQTITMTVTTIILILLVLILLILVL